MNPIDEYAALRPDHDVATPDELDQLWDRVLTADDAPVEGEQSSEAVSVGRRRVAVLGAAASLIVGIAAIALVADRAEAPTGVAETSPESSAPTAPDERASAETVAATPVWTVTEAGWASSAPIVAFESAVAAVTLVAGPDGVAQSWVAIIDGVSDPFVQVPVPIAPLDDPSGSGDPIIAWRTDPATGNYIVSAGGVSGPDAQGVFTAVRTGGALPPGFTVLPEGTGSLAQRRVTQRFDHPDGRWIEIDTQSGGQPRYDFEMQQATEVEPFDAPDGVDVGNIVFSEEYSLLLRTGFWVSTVQTSASSGAVTDFTGMAEVVELSAE